MEDLTDAFDRLLGRERAACYFPDFGPEIAGGIFGVDGNTLMALKAGVYDGEPVSVAYGPDEVWLWSIRAQGHVRRAGS